MEEQIRPEAALHRPAAVTDAAAAEAVTRAHGAGPAHLGDPRALTILTTEHWGLLTARSLVYNEAFARAGMFLTFLSASLVALGFVYQGAGGDFPVTASVVLALDLFVGLATLGRVVRANSEEFLAIQGINRLRHAYLEMVPTLEPYLSHSPYDDMHGVLAVYGATNENPSAPKSIVHGLTTVSGMVLVIDAVVAGAAVSMLAMAIGLDARASLVGAAATAIALGGLLFALIGRAFMRHERTLEVRFPTPDRGRDPAG